MDKMASPIDIFRAAWIVPVEGPPVADAAMAVEGGRIAWVGRAADAPAGIDRDLGGVVLLPGFVNAHTHLELTCFHRCLPPRPLFEWFDELLRLIRAADLPSVVPQAVRDGATQSLAAGVTCVGDISRTGVNVATLDESPIRKVCFIELISGGLNLPNDAASLAQIHERLSKRSQPDRLFLGLSPHAPYSVTPDDLSAVAAMAARIHLPVALHFLETREEADWLRGEAANVKPLRQFIERRQLPTAKSPPAGGAIELLERTGLLACRPLLAHCNYPDPGDLPHLAAAGASVAFCPRTHRFFGHVPHPWREMMSGGVNVCIGTDSLASNESLSILEEIRFLRRISPEVPAPELLAMGTIHGARALGLADRIGSLRPGKLADFVTLPLDGAVPMDPAAWVVDGGAPVGGVWVDGDRQSRPGEQEVS
jgi:cytosine/adenosine deaminase-related metal-dependent hydrolase